MVNSAHVLPRAPGTAAQSLRQSQHPGKLSFKTESYLGSPARPAERQTGSSGPGLPAQAVPLLSLPGLAFPGCGFRLSLFPHQKGLFAEPSRAGLGLEPLLGLATVSRCNWTRLSVLTKQKREQRKEINKKDANKQTKGTNLQRGKNKHLFPRMETEAHFFESSLSISTRWRWGRARPRVDERAVPLACTRVDFTQFIPGLDIM